MNTTITPNVNRHLWRKFKHAQRQITFYRNRKERRRFNKWVRAMKHCMDRLFA